MTETYTTIDYHTAGEPFRIVTELPVAIEGVDVPAKRVFAQRSPEIERIRKILCFEPRGHADMYGGFVVPPNDAGAHFGVLFWHKDGFSTACGHGTIALGVWAVESGLVAPHPSGVTDVVIDVPSGRVTARVHTTPSGEVACADFVNVPSYLIATDVPVPTSRGELRVDLSYAGAIYAQLDARTVGLEVRPEHYAEIIAIGREIKWALNDSPLAIHPDDDRLSGVYGTIVFDSPAEVTAEGADVEGRGARIFQRNATVFADGEVDRSPCGSGTGARVATLVARGTMGAESELVHESIVGSRFSARVLGRTEVGGRPAVIPQVTGTAYLTGRHEFVIDPRDDLTPGFVLR